MIHYHIGDATRPEDTIDIGSEKNVVITHICNDIGKWGAGFVLELSKRWPEAERAYRGLDFSAPLLGTVQFVKTLGDRFTIANMIAQHSVRSVKNPKPIRYDSLQKCLREVNEYAKLYDAIVCGPRFGSGLAMGNWEKIKQTINEALVDVDVHIFDLG